MVLCGGIQFSPGLRFLFSFLPHPAVFCSVLSFLTIGAFGVDRISRGTKLGSMVLTFALPTGNFGTTPVSCVVGFTFPTLLCISLNGLH